MSGSTFNHQFFIDRLCIQVPTCNLKSNSNLMLCFILSIPDMSPQTLLLFETYMHRDISMHSGSLIAAYFIRLHTLFPLYVGKKENWKEPNGS